MRKEYYLGLKAYIGDKVPDIKLIDLDLGQYRQRGEDVIRITPAAYIKFDNIEWNTLPTKLQKTVLRFDVTLVSSTRYGDERDITDESNINHLHIEREIYKVLMTHRMKLSEVPGYESISSENDVQLLESIVRKSTGTHQAIDNLIITTTPYQCVAYDYTATPIWQNVLAELELDIQLDKNLN